MAYNNYGEQLVKDECEIRRSTVKESIDNELQSAIKNVERLTELKSLMDKNPDVERILTLMQGRL